MHIKHIAIAAAALLLSGTAGAQTYDPSSGESPLVLMKVPADGVAYFETKERARALMADRQFAEAEPLLEQLVRDYPRDPETWTMLGHACRCFGLCRRWG